MTNDDVDAQLKKETTENREFAYGARASIHDASQGMGSGHNDELTNSQLEAVARGFSATRAPIWPSGRPSTSRLWTGSGPTRPITWPRLCSTALYPGYDPATLVAR